MAEKITSAKKCRRDTMIMLFTSAFGKCRRELERLRRIQESRAQTKTEATHKNINKINEKSGARKLP